MEMLLLNPLLTYLLLTYLLTFKYDMEILTNPWSAKSGFEQPSPGVQLVATWPAGSTVTILELHSPFRRDEVCLQMSRNIFAPKWRLLVI